MADEPKNTDATNADGHGSNAETGNNDKGASSASSVSADAGKIIFSREQQAKVQELIDEAYRKAYVKANEAAKKDGGAGKDTSLVDEQLKALSSQVQTLRDEKKNNALLRTIGRHNVIDSEEVAAFTARFIRLNDDNSFTVINEAGQERLNAHAKPMLVEEFIAEWLMARPHHLRPSGASGAGSMGATFGPGASTATPLTLESIRGMSAEELNKRVAEGISIQGSAGQTFNFKRPANPFIDARKRAQGKGG